jgi:hypothetical protein
MDGGRDHPTVSDMRSALVLESLHPLMPERTR